MGEDKQSMQIARLKEEIIRLGPWHHDVQVTPEVSTSVFLEAPEGTYSSKPSFINPKEHLESILRKIYPDGLEERTFLDNACNCGGYSFAAKDLGAGECFGYDARKHWVDQARFIAENRAWSTDGMRFEELDLYDLPKMDLEPFDVTLFKGIFYHLPDPITGLKLAADLTKEIIIVNTATLNDVPDGMLSLFEEGTERPMSGVHGLAWFPTGPKVMSQILKWMGFVETRVVFWVDQKTSLSRQRGRMEIVASRKEGLLKEFEQTEKQALSGREKQKPQQQKARQPQQKASQTQGQNNPPRQIDKQLLKHNNQLLRHNNQLLKHNNQLQQQSDNLQRQLDSVTWSGAWQLLTAQRKLRSWAGHALDSVRKRSEVYLKQLRQQPHDRGEGVVESRTKLLTAPKPNKTIETANDENQRYGKGLRPGSPHYRAYVGPPDDYDLLSSIQAGLLFASGLRETHRLVDVGCGSLRAGRLLIPYLRPGHYFGIEPNRWLVEEGIKRELGDGITRVKRPTFRFVEDFSLDAFGVAFDFAVAQSVFSHTYPDLTLTGLQQIARALAPEGMLFATFMEGVPKVKGSGWFYPGIIPYSWEKIQSLVEESGLVARRIDWMHPRQSWFVATHPNNEDKLDDLSRHLRPPLRRE